MFYKILLFLFTPFLKPLCVMVGTALIYGILAMLGYQELYLAPIIIVSIYFICGAVFNMVYDASELVSQKNKKFFDSLPKIKK